MKQILEVGDRVQMISAEYSASFIGTTGTVTYVASEPNSDGTRSASFALDDESCLRMQKFPGYTVTTLDSNLKFLKPEKASKAAKIDAKFSKRLDKISDLTMKGNNTSRETELTVALALALAALDVIDEPSKGVKARLTDVKEAMLAELR